MATLTTETHPRDRALVHELRAALRTDGLFTLYQPVVRTDDGSLTGAEALARWPHRRLGMVPPARFVAIAEQHDLAAALGRFVLRDAAAQADWWNRHTPGDPLVVSVNVPATALAAPGEIDRLTQIVAGHDTSPDQVMIELTGCGASARTDRDVDELQRSIAALRNRGFRLAVDDIAGCAVLPARLGEGAIDAVKIDRSLMSGIGRSDEARRSVAFIAEQAHAVGAEVIAKGVEGPRHLAMVRGLGCDQAQGFGVAAPGTARQVAERRWREMERQVRALPA